MPRPRSFIDGERIRKARTLRRVEPVYEHLAVALATIPALRFVKLVPGRLSASNWLSTDGKKNPVVTVGGEGIKGVELLVDTEIHVVQFYAITSAEQGVGRQIMEAVVSATPADWFLAAPLDWSGGGGSAWGETIHVCECSEAAGAGIGVLASRTRIEWAEGGDTTAGAYPSEGARMPW